jgi:hypothetical protein
LSLLFELVGRRKKGWLEFLRDSQVILEHTWRKVPRSGPKRFAIKTLGGVTVGGDLSHLRRRPSQGYAGN